MRWGTCAVCAVPGCCACAWLCVCVCGSVALSIQYMVLCDVVISILLYIRLLLFCQAHNLYFQISKSHINYWDNSGFAGKFFSPLFNFQSQPPIHRFTVQESHRPYQCQYQSSEQRVETTGDGAGGNLKNEKITSCLASVGQHAPRTPKHCGPCAEATSISNILLCLSREVHVHGLVHVCKNSNL